MWALGCPISDLAEDCPCVSICAIHVEVQGKTFGFGLAKPWLLCSSGESMSRLKISLSLSLPLWVDSTSYLSCQGSCLVAENKTMNNKRITFGRQRLCVMYPCRFVDKRTGSAHKLFGALHLTHKLASDSPTLLQKLRVGEYGWKLQSRILLPEEVQFLLKKDIIAKYFNIYLVDIH